MPTYLFRNKDTNEEFEEFMSISARETFLLENPNVEQIHTPNRVISGRNDVVSGTDSSWKEVLSKIAEKHPNSNLADRYGRRTSKQIKTQQILDKHIKKQQQKDR